MRELVSVVLAAHVGASPGKIAAHGDTVSIPPRAATPLALTLSELGVNALKHGALSDQRGEIRIDWRRVPPDSLEITWLELHRNHDTGPRSEGTGSVLMRGLIQYELNGTLDFEHDADRLECRIVIPIGRTAGVDRSNTAGAST
jgi:two-component sensor histidine kinase